MTFDFVDRPPVSCVAGPTAGERGKAMKPRRQRTETRSEEIDAHLEARRDKTRRSSSAAGCARGGGSSSDSGGPRLAGQARLLPRDDRGREILDELEERTGQHPY